MPLIRIPSPEKNIKIRHGNSTKNVMEVVLKTLALKQVRYDYVSKRWSIGIVGDGFPVVDVI